MWDGLVGLLFCFVVGMGVVVEPPADFGSLRGEGDGEACWFVAMVGCGGRRILGPPAQKPSPPKGPESCDPGPFRRLKFYEDIWRPLESGEEASFVFLFLWCVYIIPQPQPEIHPFPVKAQ